MFKPTLGWMGRLVPFDTTDIYQHLPWITALVQVAPPEGLPSWWLYNRGSNLSKAFDPEYRQQEHYSPNVRILRSVAITPPESLDDLATYDPMTFEVALIYPTDDEIPSQMNWNLDGVVLPHQPEGFVFYARYPKERWSERIRRLSKTNWGLPSESIDRPIYAAIVQPESMVIVSGLFGRQRGHFGEFYIIEFATQNLARILTTPSPFAEDDTIDERSLHILLFASCHCEYQPHLWRVRLKQEVRSLYTQGDPRLIHAYLYPDQVPAPLYELGGTS